jgi:aminoglycoside 6-adenylyltransferase
MLKWHIGLRTDFRISPGKMGKYFHKYLEPELWAMLEKTYSGLDGEEAWESLFAMCRLFRAIAKPLAEHYGFEYPWGDDQRVSAHLAYVHMLPREAKEMY